MRLLPRKRWSVWVNVTDDDGKLIRNNLHKHYWLRVNANNEAIGLQRTWAAMDSIYHLSNQEWYVQKREFYN